MFHSMSPKFGKKVRDLNGKVNIGAEETNSFKIKRKRRNNNMEPNYLHFLFPLVDICSVSGCVVNI